MAWRLGASITLASLLAVGCGRVGYDLLARHGAAGDGADGASDGGDGTLPDGGAAPDDSGAAQGDASPGSRDGGGSPPDDGGSTAATCPAPVEPGAPGPLYRYEFGRTDSLAEDTVSGRSGSTTNATQAEGLVELSGSSTSYVQFPSGLVTVLDALTVMMWVRWDSGPPDQALFDFGQSAQNHVALLTPGSSAGVTLEYTTGNTSLSLGGSTALTIGAFHHVAVELEPVAGRFAVYVDGALQVETTGVTFDLADLRDDNMWLGRSNAGDNSFRGAYDEVRLYDRALGPCAIAHAAQAGAASTSFARCADPADVCRYVAEGDLWLCDGARSYDVAAQRCADAGMALLSITDQGRNAAFAGAANGSLRWFGLNDRSVEGTFAWCDGRAPSFTAWDANEPNDQGDTEDCVALTETGAWNDLRCDWEYGYACAP